MPMLSAHSCELRILSGDMKVRRDELEVVPQEAKRILAASLHQAKKELPMD